VKVARSVLRGLLLSNGEWLLARLTFFVLVTFMGDVRATPKTVERFFHQDYEQCINGVRLNRTEYIQHVLEQKNNMTVSSIDYKHILEKGHELFAHYYPKGKNKDNLLIEAEVIVYVSFENQQIFRINGMVRLIKGDLADVDMQNGN
jgi:hypothetical protein